jgi:hypothetical protein
VTNLAKEGVTNLTKEGVTNLAKEGVTNLAKEEVTNLAKENCSWIILFPNPVRQPNFLSLIKIEMYLKWHYYYIRRN